MSHFLVFLFALAFSGWGQPFLEAFLRLTVPLRPLFPGCGNYSRSPCRRSETTRDISGFVATDMRLGGKTGGFCFRSGCLRLVHHIFTKFLPLCNRLAESTACCFLDRGCLCCRRSCCCLYIVLPLWHKVADPLPL